MTTEQKVIAFLRKKVAQWGPNPLTYVQQAGAERLAAEFGADPDLSQFCGWLSRPVDDQIIGGVEQFIREENPVLGYVVTTIVEGLVDACARRHEINKAVANETIKAGASVVGLASLFVGLVMMLGQAGQD
jgi:hypothetical protein